MRPSTPRAAFSVHVAGPRQPGLLREYLDRAEIVYFRTGPQFGVAWRRLAWTINTAISTALCFWRKRLTAAGPRAQLLPHQLGRVCLKARSRQEFSELFWSDGVGLRVKAREIP